ncbi:MAG: DUF5777 family beta-barrel protein [Schleiferiaceae bacterium]|nr:DUF5777 family beta-barrel protein [Schleiferiaceae bacterium]
MKKFFPFLFLLVWLPSHAQDDLFDLLDEPERESTDYTIATFKGTRIVNMQTNELPAAGVLQFMIQHRFGAINDDFLYNFFGLDRADIRMGFDYSFTDWLNIGVGRSSIGKTYDGFLKLRLARQATGKKSFPISITAYSATNVITQRFPSDLPTNFTDRLNYTHQIIFARKFSESFSLQIAPTIVHFNLVDAASIPNDVFSLGIGGRYKLTKRVSLNLEYYFSPNPHETVVGNETIPFKNPLSIGFDIETGGHVFQLFLTNARGMTDPQVIANTAGEWLNGDIYFGFNLSRVFTVKKPKLPEADF